jgi:hypothetical protein
MSEITAGGTYTGEVFINYVSKIIKEIGDRSEEEIVKCFKYREHETKPCDKETEGKFQEFY